MGSLFAAEQPAPPPPAPPTYLRDEVNGVEQVPVTNADGSVTYVTRKVPLTPEQQAEKEAMDKLMKDALSEIEKLSASDYEGDADTQKVLDAWSAERESLLADETFVRTQEEEKILAKRGLSDSTAAQSVRRQRVLDEQKAKTQLQREKELLGQDIRQEKIGLQQNLYSLAANQKSLGLAQQQQAAISGQSQALAAGQAQRASVLDYYNNQLRRSQQPTTAGQLAQVAATGAGFYFGGPTGAAIGNSLFAPPRYY